jgi:hypothetical protein
MSLWRRSIFPIAWGVCFALPASETGGRSGFPRPARFSFLLAAGRRVPGSLESNAVTT